MQVKSQLNFFRNSLGSAPGFRAPSIEGAPSATTRQELHATTRLIHIYAIASRLGFNGANEMVRHGLAYLNSHHLDSENGGYFWAIDAEEIADDRKLAYGHVFVMLAAASAKLAGFVEADALFDRICETLEQRFWDDQSGLFVDEWNRDWSELSPYRGMNANMHGVEALLAAFEATGDTVFLSRAGRILEFFIGKNAAANGWRIPEHYRSDWTINRNFQGDPMFQPAGTTPGHSFEMARLLLHHWDLSGRPKSNAVERARKLVDQALSDAWLNEGGLAYTLNYDGTVKNAIQLWWPITEAISALSSLIKLTRDPEYEVWYRRLWCFADTKLIDHEFGGWLPEVASLNKSKQAMFLGKPDIYHSFQACFLPLTKGVSRQMIE